MSTDNPVMGMLIEYVPDIEAATEFYVEVLGLSVERQHPTFVQFRENAGARFAIAIDEPLGGGAERELYWFVDDAEASLRRLEGRAELTMPLREMSFGKVFGLRGPAGKPHYLLEISPDRPSAEVDE